MRALSVFPRPCLRSVLLGRFPRLSEMFRAPVCRLRLSFWFPKKDFPVCCWLAIGPENVGIAFREDKGQRTPQEQADARTDSRRKA